MCGKHAISIITKELIVFESYKGMHLINPNVHNWRIIEMNKDWTSIQQSEFFVTNKRTNLKIIPYIGCKAGFNDIFD